MIRDAVDFDDVQGLVRFGYKRMTQATYALTRVRDVAAARAWLRSVPIASAIEVKPSPPTAMHVAFTAEGLRSLGLSDSVVAAFSPEFLVGMTEASRSRRLGDVGRNAPSNWEWGSTTTMPHLVVMFFAEPGRLTGLVQGATGKLWNEAFEELRWLDTADLDGVEPFGFADGISQPQVDWEQDRDAAGAKVTYSNVGALGEFLLGYRNEYARYTDRPVIEADAASAGLLPAADAPEKKDLGRNGTYLVMRQLQQDVRGFWQFIDREVSGHREEAERLAAAMVGRTMAGDPLATIQDTVVPTRGSEPDRARQNRFTFDDDPAGVRCPFGSHIRRANPRNADYPGHPTGLARLIAMLGLGRPAFRDDLMSPVRFHRILRRGREYGSGLSPTDALAPAPPNDPERGLHFIGLNANISRQFEFLQNAWLMNTKFSGLTGESDPLVGNREATPDCPITDDFIIQEADRPARRISGIPQFVTVRGGAYFFLPSLRALRYLTEAARM